VQANTADKTRLEQFACLQGRDGLQNAGQQHREQGRDADAVGDVIPDHHVPSSRFQDN